MAKIHDKFIVELAEVIKGYGNDPDVEDPFKLSEFYRFYELPNIAVSRENFEKMKPYEDAADVAPVRHGAWITHGEIIDCSACKNYKWSIMPYADLVRRFRYCPGCGARMDQGDNDGEIH